MTLHRVGYELQLEAISGNGAFGSAALVPWDTEIFGFRVAAYKPGSICAGQDMTPVFASLRSWLEANEISLCSSTIPASDSFSRSWLPEAGFRFVDSTLQVSLGPLSRAHLPKQRLELRPAEPEDHPAIGAIAAQAFAHGRYHADPVFPKELANLRYRRWMQTALSGSKPEDRVFVLGKSGQVLGFYHVTVEGDLSDLRLAAIAPDLKRTGVGIDLYVGVLETLRNMGIRRVISRISSANTGVMNIYALLGFRFSHPEVIYHWHP
jgi:L-amino acid N-acyltransferase YncA